MTTNTDAEDFAERMFSSALGYFDILSIYVGLRLELYGALNAGGSKTSHELAERAGIHERYAREWLEQQATRGILHADVTGPEPRFSLPAA
ncbi:MAG TPA: SAM-dependent methyltransferase, partial [Actinomycetota bacterium]|nr:SAM-dependent methyltransferase [Actinomycetota bacterium]